MATHSADENLLFGVLALQMDFIDRAELIAATTEWISDKSQSLAAVLVRRGKLTERRRRVIEELVQEHISQHGDDPQKSLAAVRSLDEVRDALEGLRDADVQRSLPPPAAVVADLDPHSTRMPAPRPTDKGSRFQIVGFHAEGGLGRVSRAVDHELNREVAFKEIQPRYADRPDSRTRFCVEAEITGCLEHPGVVPVYSLGQSADGRPYYAMRFVEGRDLLEAIQELHENRPSGFRSEAKRKTLRELVSRLTAVCHVVHYAHKRGVLHRDLKPKNIMLGPDNETLVVDWGLARTLDAKTPSWPTSQDVKPIIPKSSSQGTPTLMGEAVGTPPYMSPEQARGEHDRLTPQADVYSLGATLYHLLVNRPPVEGQSVPEIIDKVRRGDIAAPRAVDSTTPAALSAICLKAMAPSPKDRYASAEELAQDLQRWLDDEPVLAYREPWVDRAARWMRRHRTQTVSGAVALTIVAVVAVVAAFAIHAARRETEFYYQEARGAVDRNFTLVSESTLLEQPGLQPLRRDLLKDAQSYYEDWLRRRGADASLAGEAALSHFRVARVDELLGEYDQALVSYEQARRVQDDLVRQSPDNLVRLRELSLTLHAMGRTHQARGDLDRALTFYQQAIKLRKRLAERDQDDPENQRLFASNLMSLATIHQSRREFEKAEELHDEAQAIRAAARRESDDPRLARDVGRGHYNQAELLRTWAAATRDETQRAERLNQATRKIDAARQVFTGVQQLTVEDRFLNALCMKLKGDILLELDALDGDRLADAIASYSAASEDLERLVEENPAVLAYQHRVGGALLNLGAASMRQAARLKDQEEQWTENMDAAAAAFDKSLFWLRPLAERTPPHPEYRRDFAVLLLELARFHFAEGRNPQARDHIDRALETLDPLVEADPSNQDYVDRKRETVELRKQIEQTP